MPDEIVPGVPAGPSVPSLPFEAVVDAADEAVIVTTAQLDLPGPTVVYVNPAFTRMTGYAGREILGRTPRMLKGPRSDRRELARMHAVLADGGIYRGQLLNARKDGSDCVVEGHIAPILDADGHVSHFFSIQRDVTDARAADAQLENRLDELRYRVRSLLGSVRSIVSRSVATSASVEDCVMHLEGRIGAFARAQAATLYNPSAGADLSSLIAEELRAHAAREGDDIALEGPELRLSPRAAECLGLAFHELAANAVKFGALSGRAGRLRIVWRVEEAAGGPSLVLEWKEGGLSDIVPPRSQGFGTDQLARVLPSEFDALTELAFEADGLRCTITLPLDRIAGRR